MLPPFSGMIGGLSLRVTSTSICFSASSSSMMPVPVPAPTAVDSVALVGVPSVTTIVSSSSFTVSPVTATTMFAPVVMGGTVTASEAGAV